MNLNDLSSIDDFFMSIQDIPSIDVLINNAAFTKNIDPNQILNSSNEDITKIVQSNVSGTFVCMKSFINNFVSNSKNKNKNIINISSNSTKTLNASNLLYVASKAAIESYTKSLAKSYGDQVRVNCVSPGLMKTKTTNLSKESRFKYVIDNTPLKRLCYPKDIFDCIISIIDKMKFLNGEVIKVDGGRTL